MKYNLSKRKIKLYLIYIINFILFILFARFFTILHDDIAYDVFSNIIPSIKTENIIIQIIALLYNSDMIAALLFKALVEYLFAKRIHLMRFFENNKPLKRTIYIIVIEFLVLYEYGHYTYGEEWVNTIECIELGLIQSLGFIPSYIIYKLFKSISKTRVFCWIKYLYPKFLEKIPVIYYQIFFVLIAYPLIKYFSKPINIAEGEEIFLLSGKIFFVLIGIVLLFNIFKKAKHVLFKKTDF